MAGSRPSRGSPGSLRNSEGVFPRKGFAPVKPSAVRHAFGASERKKARGLRASIESLEDRCLMASSSPDVAMVSAMTADSRGVTVDYEVQGGAIPRPITFGVYRSADDRFDPSDIPVGSLTVV